MVRCTGCEKQTQSTMPRTPDLNLQWIINCCTERVWVLDLLRPLSTVFMFRIFQVQCGWAVSVWRRHHPGKASERELGTPVSGGGNANVEQAPTNQAGEATNVKQHLPPANASTTISRLNCMRPFKVFGNVDIGHTGVHCACFIGSLMAVEVCRCGCA